MKDSTKFSFIGDTKKNTPSFRSEIGFWGNNQGKNRLNSVQFQNFTDVQKTDYATVPIGEVSL